MGSRPRPARGGEMSDRDEAGVEMAKALCESASIFGDSFAVSALALALGMAIAAQAKRHFAGPGDPRPGMAMEAAFRAARKSAEIILEGAPAK